MPRLPPALIHHARRIDAHLSRLLPVCRDLSSAKLELKWLREHCLERITHTNQPGTAPPLCHKTGQRQLQQQQQQLLAKLVSTRASGKPLQYVIGTEFFGDLEIQCREGVLIPRPETANWITYLAKRIRRSLYESNEHYNPSQSQSHLQIKTLDLCTGSGCIPLLFHHVLSQQVDEKHTITPNMHCLGVDVSPTAVKLANHNLDKYLKSQELKKTPVNHISSSQIHVQPPRVNFLQSDIFSPTFSSQLSVANCSTVDILVSNPPYISPIAFNHQTARSVRKFEPKIALVPSLSSSSSTLRPQLQDHDSMGDTFYPRLLGLGHQTDAQIVAMEVSDEPQAFRVAKLAESQNLWRDIEVWRDALDEGIEGSSAVEYREGVRICGSGNGRVVVCRRGNGDRWLQP